MLDRGQRTENSRIGTRESKTGVVADSVGTMYGKPRRRCCEASVRRCDLVAHSWSQGKVGNCRCNCPVGSHLPMNTVLGNKLDTEDKQ